MNWEDERWVKLYTRDSVTWLSWDWRARLVMMSLIRKVDRAGVVDVGSRGVEALASMIDAPVDIVRDGIAQLVAPNPEDGKPTIVWNGPQLVIPHFIDAQESKTSNAARQRALRERRRDFAIRGVTQRDEHDASPGDVTQRDEPARPTRRETEGLAGAGNGALPTTASPVTPRERVTAARNAALHAVDRDPELASSLAHFARHYKTRYGQSPSRPPKQIKERARDLIEQHGDAEWRARVVLAFTEEREWPRHPYDLAKFIYNFDLFTRALPATKVIVRGNPPGVGRFEPAPNIDYARTPWDGDAPTRFPWEDE